LITTNIAISAEQAPDATDGERKTVTALFADIKGSMELMEDLDPEEARAVVDPALKLMIDAVHHYDGYIVQSTGDGIFALFGAPVAHEDHPQRALYAALRMQDAMRRYSAKLRQAGHPPIEARVGVNTGEVVVRSIATSGGHAEYTPIGHSTNLAARMQALAPTGSIAATDITRKLCEGYFTFRSLGPTVVKGVSDPVEVSEVVGIGPLRTRLERAVSRGLTKFVGRERELDSLRHAAEQAQAGRGQIVAIIGKPGVGKSRLFYEFKAIEGGNCLMLEAFSVSHGKATAYLPVIGLLRDYFRILPEDDARTRREKVAGKIVILDQALQDTLPYLYALLGIIEGDDPLAQMDPQIRGRRTRDAIKRILLRETLNQPLVAICEDLHWIDAETQAVLNFVVDAIANARILLLVSYRPEYRHEWGSRAHYTQIRLDPLGRESAEEMLSTLLGEDKDLTPLKRQIVERTQGTPFFMEEMVQTLFEEGVLQRNGGVKLAKSMSTVKIPATVQAVLASRIDRLPAGEKELLQLLAVLGCEFPLNLVQCVTKKSSNELEQLLAQLELAEFIFEQPTSGGALEYIFKHVLTQEVAYSSLLSERRRALHDRAAQAIEDLYGNQIEDHYGDLANHYLRATNASKAALYARLAAEQALSRAAYPQAMSLIETALNLVDQLPEEAERSRTELALRSIESTVALVLHGASSRERERAINRMCELAQGIGEADQFVRALSTLSGFYFTKSESPRGLELAMRCLAIGGSVQDEGLLVDLRYNAGLLACFCGSFKEAASYVEDALRQARGSHCRMSPQWGELYASGLPGISAFVLQSLGRVNASAKAAEEGLEYARKSRHLLSLGMALARACMLSFDRRQPDIARALCEELIPLSKENGFAEWLPWGQFIHGWALFQLGRAAEGLLEMEAGLAGFDRLGGVPRLQHCVAVRADAIAGIGRVDEAVAIINQTLTHIEQTGEKLDHAEILRLKGEVLLLRDVDATVEAEACFHTALEIARAQEAKWWELRAILSLSRLLRNTNRREEARLILGEIYKWFTEGYDLPDLKDAKALLDELSA
jgi:class 3 adenylate cyclase